MDLEKWWHLDRDVEIGMQSIIARKEKRRALQMHNIGQMSKYQDKYQDKWGHTHLLLDLLISVEKKHCKSTRLQLMLKRVKER